MIIRVDDDPNNVNELLYIRSAWHLAVDLDIPELDPEPQPGSSLPPAAATLETWSARWKRAWQRAWDWYGIRDAAVRPTSLLLRELTQPDQPLHPAIPPFWSAEYGRDGVDDAALAAWQRQLEPSHHLPFEEEPERRCLPALISAWETGLFTIVTLPYSGYFAHRLSETHLAVSNATRDNESSYTRALATPLHSTVR
ncbi:MAG: hypothetical protein JWM49_799 [Microbacteriaceae bacterium]|nr:hypothetical protein [Microbacteriaceae bacterium]